MHRKKLTTQRALNGSRDRVVDDPWRRGTRSEDRDRSDASGKRGILGEFHFQNSAVDRGRIDSLIQEHSKRTFVRTGFHKAAEVIGAESCRRQMIADQVVTGMRSSFVICPAFAAQVFERIQLSARTMTSE